MKETAKPCVFKTYFAKYQAMLAMIASPIRLRQTIGCASLGNVAKGK